MLSRRHLAAFMSLGVVVWAAGCGDGFKRAPVSGHITVDGKPMDNVAVTFQTTNQMADPNWTIIFTNGSASLLNATNNDIALITSATTTLGWTLQPFRRWKRLLGRYLSRR